MTDYSKLSDFEINKRVALVLGLNIKFISLDCDDKAVGIIVGKKYTPEKIGFDPCNNPADAWQIIVSNGISLVKYGHGMWLASSDAYWVDGVEWQIDGEAHQNPLRAAMIVYLMMQDANHANS